MYLLITKDAEIIKNEVWNEITDAWMSADDEGNYCWHKSVLAVVAITSDMTVRHIDLDDAANEETENARYEAEHIREISCPHLSGRI